MTRLSAVCGCRLPLLLRKTGRDIDHPEQKQNPGAFGMEPHSLLFITDPYQVAQVTCVRLGPRKVSDFRCTLGSKKFCDFFGPGRVKVHRGSHFESFVPYVVNKALLGFVW